MNLLASETHHASTPGYGHAIVAGGLAACYRRMVGARVSDRSELVIRLLHLLAPETHHASARGSGRADYARGSTGVYRPTARAMG